jgi:hypothetical protein
MTAALNSVKTFHRQNGDIYWQRHLTRVYFIVKSSSYNSQIKVFLTSAALDWAPPPNENLKNAAAVKRVNTVYV